MAFVCSRCVAVRQAAPAALALLLLVAVSAYADSFKCQSEERVIRRDRPCLPGEIELEATRTRDLRRARQQPKPVVLAPLATPAAPLKAASSATPGTPVSAATPGAALPPDTVYAAPSTVGTNRVTGVVGAAGAVVTPEAKPAPPTLTVPSLSDPPEKQLDSLQQLALYCQTCATGEFNAPACKEFWTWSVVVALAIPMLIVLLFLKRLIARMIKEHRAINEHKKWLAAQAAVADSDTMKKHLWEGDVKYETELTQEQIAAAIAAKINPSPQT